MVDIAAAASRGRPQSDARALLVAVVVVVQTRPETKNVRNKIADRNSMNKQEPTREEEK